jgi:NAD+ synthase
MANAHNLLVAGTGNNVEDFGIGFFTKYGDGGVDISPIGELTKSEVRELARYIGVANEIVDAVPTDGLWDDGRSDESQIGATYDELEWAMDYIQSGKFFAHGCDSLTARQKEVLSIYQERHKNNQHKLQMPPICIVRKD